MKRFILAVFAVMLAVAPGYSVQAHSQGPTQITVPSGAGVDSFTVTQNDTTKLAVNVVEGGVLLDLKTIAQINALTAAATGQMVICTDCTRSAICIASGTVNAGSFVIAVATGTFVGSTWSGLQHCQ